SASAEHAAASLRLNKYISETGICSRREADAWIAAGRVRVNGAQALLGTQVEAGDQVEVDGKPVAAKRSDTVYIALNKPVGITCTTERHIPGNIIDYINHPQRIFPIGRLDKDSEGLILLANNGDIVNEILREENEHEKEYVVTLERPLEDDFLFQTPVGGQIPGTTTKPCKLRRIARDVSARVPTQALNRHI